MSECDKCCSGDRVYPGPVMDHSEVPYCEADHAPGYGPMEFTDWLILTAALSLAILFIGILAYLA